MMNKLALFVILAEAPPAVRYSVETPNCGIIDPATGAYTAPANVPAPLNCRVTGTSTSDPSKVGIAEVSLVASDIPPPLPPPPAPSAGFVYLPGFARDCTGPIGLGYPTGVLPVCDPKEMPMGTFPVPAAGGSYTDANFGYNVKVLCRNCSHGYSNPSAFTATGKYALVWINAAQRAEVIDVATAQILAPGTRPRTGGEPRPHPTDDDYYYFNGIGVDQPKIQRHRISTGVNELVMDIAQWFRGAVRAVTLIPRGPTAVKPGQGVQFTGTVELGPAPEIKDGGAGNITADGMYGFWVPDIQQACIADVFRRRLYCKSYAEYGATNIQGMVPSHGVEPSNGKRYAILMTAPAAVFFTVNEALGKLDFSFRGPDAPRDASDKTNDNGVCETVEDCFAFPHGDIGHDEKGQNFWLGYSDRRDQCGTELVKYMLASEGNLWRERKTVARIHACGGDKWVNNHNGCSVTRPTCTLSTDYPGALRADNDLTTPVDRGNYNSEIWAIKFGADSTEIHRIAQHRSPQWVGDQYWSKPRACPSPDGRLAMWDSNFGYPPVNLAFRNNVVMAPTGF